MRDPYAVLGVPGNASDEDIKKKYRELSRKYHPDANINNPNRDKAEEMFKEVQTAYEQIIKEREEGIYGTSAKYGSTYSYGSSAGYGRTNSGSTSRASYGDPYGGFNGAGHGSYGSSGGSTSTAQGDYENYMRATATFLNNGYFNEARHTLDSLDPNKRNAMWYYYSAVAHAGLRNTNTALDHARNAVRMEPGNKEFMSFYEHMISEGRWYESVSNTYAHPSPMEGSDRCVKLCIANLLCQVLCGGGIFWC